MTVQRFQRRAVAAVLGRARGLVAGVLALGVCGLLPARAAASTWDGTTGAWSDPNKWDPVGVPGAGAAVVIPGGSVFLDAPTADLASFTMNGGTLTFSNWTTKLVATAIAINTGTVTHVANYVTATNPAGQWVPVARVYLECGSFLIASGASINVNSKGYPGGIVNSTAGHGPGYGSASTGGGSHGGGGYASGNRVYGSLTEPDQPGSGGGRWDRPSGSIGGWGGGAVRIDSGSGAVTVNGTIAANGITLTVGRQGAGSGGSVWITCQTIAGTGLVTAKGGGDGNYADGCAGGGGRIAVHYDTVDQALLPVPGIVFSAAATTDNANDANDGTLYFPDSRFLKAPEVVHGGVWAAPDLTAWATESLTISNVSLTFLTPGLSLEVTNDVQILGTGGRLSFSNAAMTVGGDLLVRQGQLVVAFDADASRTLTVGGAAILTNGAAWRMTGALTNGLSPIDGGKVEVGGLLKLYTNCWVYPQSQRFNGGSPRFKAAAVDIAAGAGFDANQRGFARASAFYSAGYGPGKGAVNGGGGSYGGQGGPPTGGGGVPYGSRYAPIHPGSGGGVWDRYPGDAGGLIWIEAAGRARIHGTLTANGGSASSGSGGGGGSSGGGILVDCRTLDTGGSTVLSAKGGNASTGVLYGPRGDGAGGRIAVWVSRMIPDYRAHLLAGGDADSLAYLIRGDNPIFWQNIQPFQGSTSVDPGQTNGNAAPGTVEFLRCTRPGMMVFIM